MACPCSSRRISCLAYPLCSSDKPAHKEKPVPFSSAALLAGSNLPQPAFWRECSKLWAMNPISDKLTKRNLTRLVTGDLVKIIFLMGQYWCWKSTLNTLSLSNFHRAFVKLIFPLYIVEGNGTAWYSGKYIATSYADPLFCVCNHTTCPSTDQNLRVWIWSHVTIKMGYTF